MRTFGLGGDSEVRINDGLDRGVVLGPKRVMPVSLLARDHAQLVHTALNCALSLETPPEDATRFIIAQFTTPPGGLDAREAAVAERLIAGPLRWSDAVQSRVEEPAVARLVQRGLVMICGITPSDASHVLGRLQEWDSEAARKALTLMARRRIGSGDRLATTAEIAAQIIIDQLTEQTSCAVLETSFAEEEWPDPAGLACHQLIKAGRRRHRDIVRIDAGLAVPVIGLGASAKSYYGAVGTSLGCETILPDHGGVANAIGAIVGQVSVHAEGSVTSAGEGGFRVHLSKGPIQFSTRDEAFDALRAALTEKALTQAAASGVEEVRIDESLDLREAQIEAQSMFIEATMRITARGRPRITG